VPFETTRAGWSGYHHGWLSQTQLVQALVGGQAAARSHTLNLCDSAQPSPRRATATVHVYCNWHPRLAEGAAAPEKVQADSLHPSFLKVARKSTRACGAQHCTTNTHVMSSNTSVELKLALPK
jgi:hypothetical protein